jgi:hypothetical protein
MKVFCASLKAFNEVGSGSNAFQQYEETRREPGQGSGSHDEGIDA